MLQIWSWIWRLTPLIDQTGLTLLGLCSLEQLFFAELKNTNIDIIWLTTILPTVQILPSIFISQSLAILAPASWKQYIMANIKLPFNSDVYLYALSINPTQIRVTEIYSIKDELVEQELGLWNKEFNFLSPIKGKWERRKDL